MRAEGRSSDRGTVDELVNLLLASKGEEERAKIVADNVLSFDQGFWMRIAERVDEAEEEEQKAALSGLANSVMKMVDNLVRATENQMNDSKEILQEILLASADPVSGEWRVPLSHGEVESMRQAIKQRADRVDEAVLANAYAWMRKANTDNLPGMVEVIQTALQLYAGLALSAPASSNPLDVVLAAVPSEWDSLLMEEFQSGRLNEESFQEEIQKKMESVVIGLESGSYRQRVQAEYLKELEQRGRNVLNVD